MQNFIAGVDIGGTHVTTCLVNAIDGSLVSSSMTRVQIDPSQNREIVIKVWAEAIRQCFNKAEIKPGKIGIAMPGPFDYEKGISYIKGLCKYEDLYGLNVKDLLAEKLDISASDILLMNDAAAFLQGELFCGAAVGYDNVVGITLGTGLGSASYYNDSVYEGDLYNMEYNNSRAEDHVCARWLISEYEILTGEKVSGVKTIAERFYSGSDSSTVFRQFGINLGDVLIKRYEAQSPQAIVIGGNIAKAWDCFIPYTKETLSEKNITWVLTPAKLGEEAALIGASYLWK